MDRATISGASGLRGRTFLGSRLAGSGGAGTASAMDEGAWISPPHAGQGPLMPAMLAGTVSLLVHFGQEKVSSSVTGGCLDFCRAGNPRQ